MADERKKVRDFGNGIWIDDKGDGHFEIATFLASMGLADTPKHRQMFYGEIKRTMRTLAPDIGINWKPYELVNDGEAITCLCCGRTSYNPGDVANHYCGNCDVFLDDL